MDAFYYTQKTFEIVSCPSCGTDDLIQLDEDFFCYQCDWNSILVHVNAGTVNDLIHQYETRLKEDPDFLEREERQRQSIGEALVQKEA